MATGCTVPALLCVTDSLYYSEVRQYFLNMYSMHASRNASV